MRRFRRLRKNQLIRNLVAETRLSVEDLVMPYFIIEGRNKIEQIKTMPGTFRLSVDNLLREIERQEKLGIKAILLFGIPGEKNPLASEAYAKDGIIQKAVRSIKSNINDIIIITDVCLCGYTPHGHCGILKNRPPSIVDSPQKRNKNYGLWTMDYGLIDDDATLEVLTKIALSHAEAGVDFVAPSAMMDGQVRAVRESLDKSGFKDVGILAYSAKYESNFYGPFRDALDSAPQFGDRKGYQMDYRNSDEALREIKQDIDEGADIMMVKPALSYLDIIYRAKQKFNMPIAAYNVSGEYSMVKAASEKRWLDEKKAVLEILTSIKRAGADMIITYYAKEVAKWFRR